MLWVLSGWDAPIIINRMIQVGNQESPATALCAVNQAYIRLGIQPLATVAGAEKLNICMKKTCYEYEVCDVS
jgi:hypothetical protein